MYVDFCNTPLLNRRLQRYGRLIAAARFSSKMYLIAAVDLLTPGKDSFRKQPRIGTDNILRRALHRNLKKQFPVLTGNPGNLKRYLISGSLFLQYFLTSRMPGILFLLFK